MSEVRKQPWKTPLGGGSAWRWYADPEQEAEYLALATFIQLRSVWSLPRFEWFTQRVHRQLARTPGLIGYSFRGRLPKEYWTLSAWESNRHLLAYIRAMPHARVMTVFPSSMERFGSVRWKVKGSDLPPAWSEGLRRLHEEMVSDPTARRAGGRGEPRGAPADDR